MATCGTNSCFCKICLFLCLVVAQILAFILAVILLPLIVTLVLLLLLYRTFVQCCAFCQEDLGSILPGCSALLAGDEIYKQPLAVNIALFQFEGHCDVPFMTIFLQDNWLGATSPAGRFKYPELRQSVVTFMGFYFWKNDKQFDVKNHVKLYGNGSECESVETYGKLNEIWNELSMKPFDAERSPWEVFVVPRFREAESWGEERAKWVMIFRWHHCLSDGFSILNLMSSVANFDVRRVTRNHDLPETRSFLGSFGAVCGLLFGAPFVILELLCQKRDRNPWHLSDKKLTRYWHLGVGKNLPATAIHDVKIGMNVSFSAVLLAAVAGTLRQMMLSGEGSDVKKLPEFVTCGIPLPVPKHPEKLRNNWAVGTIYLPIREENPCKRIQIIERFLKELKASKKPIVAYKLASWFGCLPSGVIKACAKNNVTTVVCSIMPGPGEVIKNFEGKPLLDAGYITGLGPGRNGISFTVFSYTGSVKFAVTVDSAFSPESSLATKLMLGIEDELNFLKQSCIKLITVHTA